jgi:hypothetical protein
MHIDADVGIWGLFARELAACGGGRTKSRSCSWAVLLALRLAPSFCPRLAVVGCRNLRGLEYQAEVR